MMMASRARVGVRSVLLATMCFACACGGGRTFASAHPVRDVPSAIEPQESEDLVSMLRRSPKLAPLVDDAETYRLEVLVGVVAPGEDRWERREGFRLDAEYFYPASAIKLCTAAAALETVTDLREGGTVELDVDATLRSDGKSRRRPTSIANLVGGALVMSDNEANSDLFDLVGSDEIHERMWRLGLTTFRMRHRLGVDARKGASVTSEIQLATRGGPTVVPPREGHLDLGKNDVPGVLVGESRIVGGRVVDGPMSFEEKNRISLADLQELLVKVMRPELGRGEGLRLGERERALLVDSLTALPSARGARGSYDAEHKPFLAGVEQVVPREHLTLASKSGRAYGFLVGNAYALDARTGRAFFLAATLYTNPNGRMNDDLYDYPQVAFPAFADLGELIARFALGG